MSKLTKQLILLAVALFLAFTNNTTAQDIFINEWMAKNSTIIADEAGEFDDWIELYNAGTTSVDLQGYYITDDITNPTKFQFGNNAIISPSGFLLLWADNDLDQGDLHLNFKLSANGEMIALFSPSQTLIDSISFGVQSDDISEGRYPDGSNSFFIFDDPTPGLANSAAGSTGYADAPVFNINGGFYDNSLQLTLSSASSGATIYYTLDGEDPSISSNVYTGSFSINASSIVRAIAVKAGLLDSKITSHGYFIGEHYNLPVLSLMTDPDNMWGPTGIYSNPTQDGSDWERFCQLQYFKDENLEFTANSGIRIQGSSSVGLPKKSFRLFFESEYGQKWLDYPMFGESEVASFRNLVLRAGYDDDITNEEGTLLRDPISNFKYEESGGIISEGNWAVLTINGEYWGIYEIRESINEHFVESKTGWNDFDMIRMTKEGPEVKNGTIDDWQAMTDFLMDNDFTDESNYLQATEIFDIDNLINFLAFGHCTGYHSWSWGSSVFKENVTGGKWQFTIWDMDRGIVEVGWNPFGDYDSTNPAKWANFIPRKLMENETFRHKTINRTADLFNSIFHYDQAMASLVLQKNNIQASMPKELDRWNNSLSMDDWDERVEDIDDFFYTRPTTMRNFVLYNYDLEDTNEINLDVNGNGTLHINTIDVPTYPWSGIYFEGVPVRVTAIPDIGYIFAGWSDASLPNEASVEIDFSDSYNLTANFVLGSIATDPIVINEINYHAPDAADSGDWIELYNPNDIPVDISAWFIKDESGDVFKISTSTILPANGYLTMVNDRTKFENIYSNISPIVENYNLGDFKLANSGEKIYLLNANSIIIDSVAYDDNAPWPSAADGNGPSLQLIDASSNNNLAENWAAMLPTPNALNCKRLQQNQLPGDLINSAHIENVTCFGETDGIIDISTTGNTLQYLWSNGFVSEDLEDVAGGNYELLVFSDNYCEQLVELEITTPTALEVDAQVSAMICYGVMDGSISLDVDGGTGDYSYAWEGGATSSSLSSLSADEYTVSITDAMNCQLIESYEITQAPEILLEEDIDPISCFGNTDGFIGLNPTGGTGNFTFLWDNGATTSSLNNLTADDYFVTITDALNCKLNASFEITTPAAIALTADIQDNACFEGMTGSIDLDPAGGTGSFTFDWSNNTTSSGIDGLAADTYTVTVTDAANCKHIESFEVTEASVISAQADIDAVLCNGDATGSIDLMVTGGTNDFTYLWSNNATTSGINELVADTYTVTITDAANCIHIESFEVTAASVIAAQADIDPVLCNGDETGSIDLMVTGGTNDFTYLWSNNATTSGINELAADTYTVTITDAANCKHIESFEVTTASAISTQADIDPVLCHGDATGSINLMVTGGTNDFTYLWNNNATTSGINSLIANTYTVTITDAANCQKIESFEITEAEVLAVEANLEHLNCNGEADGSIDLTVSGGNSSYTYIWNTGLTTADLNALSANTYSVTITDDSNCQVIENYELTEPTAISVQALKENISCYDGANGSLTLDVIGGAGDYSYNWSNNATTAIITELVADNYMVTIIDAADCQIIENFELTQAPAIEPIATITHLKCFGDSDGSIDIAASGGTGTLNFVWSNNVNGNFIGDLEEGDYQLTITDDNDCIVGENYSVLAPNELIVETTTIQPTAQAFGTIQLNITGGVLPYKTYLDGSLVSNFMIQGLGEGNFSLEVIDANGCIHQEDIVLQISTGIQAIEDLLSFDLYPNPSNGNFNLVFNSAKSQTFSLNIHNSIGQNFFEKEMTGKEFNIPFHLNHLAKGIYFLSIRTEEGIAIKKIFIQ